MDKSEQILELISTMNTEMKEEFKNIRNEMQGEFKNIHNEMQEGFKDVNNKFDGLQAEMQEGFREAYTERQEMKSNINKIEMTIENDINKNINLLVEGQQNLNNKIDETLKFKDEKELLTIRIEILENEITRMKARLDEIA